MPDQIFLTKTTINKHKACTHTSTRLQQTNQQQRTNDNGPTSKDQRQQADNEKLTMTIQR